MRRKGSCPCKQLGRPIARFRSNPSGSGLFGRSAALRRLSIAALSTAHRALHPIPKRPLRDPWETVNTFPGQGGGSRKHVLASLDQSLQRLGLDYVDIFYSHRFDQHTPLEETASALAQAVQQGKALYVGVSSYSASKTREIAALLQSWKVPLLIHQPAYNLFNRWIEKDLLAATDDLGAGVIAFTPLAQGMLTDKYLDGTPANARINRPGGQSLKAAHLSEANLARARALREIARRRGQSLAQLALSWTLRDPRVTSALIGASTAEQVRENVAALSHAPLSPAELAEIDQHAVEGGINLWEKPSTDWA